MSTSEGQQTICHYCKHLLSKGKLPASNEFSSGLNESRYINEKIVLELVNKMEERFNNHIEQLSLLRLDVWNKRSFSRNFDYLLTQCNDKEKINIEYISKDNRRQDKFKTGLGYLTLRNLIKFVLFHTQELIFNNCDDYEISQVGKCHLIKDFFDHMFTNELEVYSSLEKNISFSNLTLTNTNNLVAITEQFGEEYIKACKEILPAMFKEEKKIYSRILKTRKFTVIQDRH